MRTEWNRIQHSFLSTHRLDHVRRKKQRATIKFDRSGSSEDEVSAYWMIGQSKITQKSFIRSNARSIKFILQRFSYLLAFCLIFSILDARKIIIKSNPERNADLFGDKDFTFSQDQDDKKEPTIFKGNVMKTKTLINENVTGKKSFKFAWVDFRFRWPDSSFAHNTGIKWKSRNICHAAIWRKLIYVLFNFFLTRKVLERKMESRSSRSVDSKQTTRRWSWREVTHTLELMDEDIEVRNVEFFTIHDSCATINYSNENELLIL